MEFFSKMGLVLVLLRILFPVPTTNCQIVNGVQVCTQDYVPLPCGPLKPGTYCR